MSWAHSHGFITAKIVKIHLFNVGNSKLIEEGCLQPCQKSVSGGGNQEFSAIAGVEVPFSLTPPPRSAMNTPPMMAMAPVNV